MKNKQVVILCWPYNSTFQYNLKRTVHLLLNLKRSASAFYSVYKQSYVQNTCFFRLRKRFHKGLKCIWQHAADSSQKVKASNELKLCVKMRSGELKEQLPLFIKAMLTRNCIQIQMKWMNSLGLSSIQCGSVVPLSQHTQAQHRDSFGPKGNTTMTSITGHTVYLCEPCFLANLTDLKTRDRSVSLCFFCLFVFVQVKEATTVGHFWRLWGAKGTHPMSIHTWLQKKVSILTN